MKRSFAFISASALLCLALLAGWQQGFTLYMILWAAATLLLCVVLLRWLKKQGAAIFAAL